MDKLQEMKERLERIKKYACPNTYDVHYGQTERVDDLEPGDFNWLIETIEQQQQEIEKLKGELVRSGHCIICGDNGSEVIGGAVYCSDCSKQV